MSHILKIYFERFKIYEKDNYRFGVEISLKVLLNPNRTSDQPLHKVGFIWGLLQLSQLTIHLVDHLLRWPLRMWMRVRMGMWMRMWMRGTMLLLGLQLMRVC